MVAVKATKSHKFIIPFHTHHHYYGFELYKWLVQLDPSPVPLQCTSTARHQLLLLNSNDQNNLFPTPQPFKFIGFSHQYTVTSYHF